MYITFIRPLLEYADIVWDNCSIKLKNDIEDVQHEAAGIVTGSPKLCSIDRLMADLNWDTLAERRRKHRLILFVKMKNGISPEYITHLDSPATSSTICKTSKKPQLLYYYGSRQHQGNHTRLRLWCSSLNYDIHRRNIIPCPLCACGAVETVLHYLTHSMRDRYINDLPCAPTLENFLFGNDRPTPDSSVFLKFQNQSVLTHSN